MGSEPAALHLFEGYGLEVEWTIVDASTLDVLPVADRLLAAAGGAPDDVVRGPLTWSNELVLHVVELKMTEPAPSLRGLDAVLQAGVADIQSHLAPLGGRLLPGGAHPWMDPGSETRLWPHGSSEVYATFDRIFDCRGHGWSNLQSVHLNLPFSGEEEFARLHAAIRLVLPLIPGLAASSPFLDGVATGLLDSRLHAYGRNCARVPSVTGAIVPEPTGSMEEYRERILGTMFRDLEPLDPSGIIRHEWANARGAIPRFERSTIEIRLIDAQECPAADLAVVDLVARAVRALAEERWRPLVEVARWPVEPLHALLLDGIVRGEEATADDPEYLACFGLGERRGATIGQVWRHLADELPPEGDASNPAADVILSEGTLARRLLRAAGEHPTGDRLRQVYRRLADCLTAGTPFS